MAKFIFKNVKIPNICNECKYCGHYETDEYIRNPHCCCELIWKFQEEEYRINKNFLDENCPLKIGYLVI